ncbi:MAG TPA: ABC transporter permease [Gemmatimonadaceae bacterium]|nr:ABC transporter permease [Gemmatimonadaceae bacterium]
MLRGIVARARSLWLGVRQRAHVEADMNDEFRLHLELRAGDLVRTGLSPDAAARQARLEFGSTERYKEQGRRSRGLRRVDDVRMSWLDFKLGFRMLVRYPGLTLVGGLAMAFAIWIGAGAFELATQIIRPRLPLPDGSSIVAIENWDVAANRPELHIAHDFVTWRESLRSVTELGAYRVLERNLITGEGRGEPVNVAEITASAFRMTRVPPLMGRTLLEADERPGSPAVVVIGYDVWRRRFAGDPNVIGQTIRLARSPVTIVGVMPERYAFPVAQSFWVPLRLDVSGYGRRAGPDIRVFARLSPGSSMSDARAELTALGRRASVDFRATHEHLRPRIMPFAKSIVNITGWRSAGVMSVNLPLLMLLTLICGNVALLMFARAATRESEIIVRTALGAGRGRIVMQLFTEALVLGGVAAVAGLTAASAGLRWVLGVVVSEFQNGKPLPFWFQDTLSPTTLLYAVVLTVLAAAIAGIVPALKVTRGVAARLKQTTAGSGGLRFGGVWTVVIVAQVAVTVAFPAVAFFVRRDAVQIEQVDVGFPASQYLSARLEMDRELSPGAPGDTSRAAFAARFRATYQELERRVAAEPNVRRIAFADRLPLMYHPHRLIGIDSGGAAPLHPAWPAGYRVSTASVSPGYFDVVDAPILSGRGFQVSDERFGLVEPGETGSQPGVVIVNQSFVRLVLGGRNPIGRRIRYVELEEWDEPRPPTDNPGPWYEIVGVVRDLGMSVGSDGAPAIPDSTSAKQAAGGDPKVAGIYHPVAPGGVYPAHMAVHVSGDPAAFGPRLRAIATDIDPTLRLYDVTALSDVTASELEFLGFWFRLLLGVAVIALFLSLAGIYAVMSFTVSRRTREIGVRIALGANRRRVVSAIFKRPLAQVASGVVSGAALVTVLAGAATGDLSAREGVIVVAYALLMMAVCLVACVVPTRRAFRIEPTEALKSES